MSIAQLVSEKVFYSSLVWSNINQCFDCLIKTIANHLSYQEINLRAPFFDINTMPLSHVHCSMVIKVRSSMEN